MNFKSHGQEMQRRPIELQNSSNSGVNIYNTWQMAGNTLYTALKEEWVILWLEAQALDSGAGNFDIRVVINAGTDAEAEYDLSIAKSSGPTMIRRQLIYPFFLGAGHTVTPYIRNDNPNDTTTPILKAVYMEAP